MHTEDPVEDVLDSLLGYAEDDMAESDGATVWIVTISM